MENDKEWKNIQMTLTNCFQICDCQRKIKSIIDALYSIYLKCQMDSSEREFTGAEWLLIAIMDSNSDFIQHGINCEYPIVIVDHPFWKWIVEVKDNPNLVDG